MRPSLAGAAAASGQRETLSLAPARYPAWDWAHVSKPPSTLSPACRGAGSLHGAEVQGGARSWPVGSDSWSYSPLGPAPGTREPPCKSSEGNWSPEAASPRLWHRDPEAPKLTPHGTAPWCRISPFQRGWEGWGAMSCSMGLTHSDFSWVSFASLWLCI